jgi:aldehyde:ferredoxin oxidoreductase
MDQRSKLYGYAGKLLRIDLSKEKISIERIEPEILRKFLGGVGIGVKLLYEEMPAGIEPLCLENKLLFTTGPLTGTIAPGSGFAGVCCKSPLTGVWSESKCGGEWGGVLKKAGYDFIVIEGQSKEPKYVVIHNDKVEVKPALKLKGQTISQKLEMIRKELGDKKFEVAAIGPAGEALVRFASIMVGGRAFGRCGTGAVMGAKNLLAIAVKGTRSIPVAEPERFRAACRKGNQKVLNATGGQGMAAGTIGDIPICDFLGDIPTKNWRSNSWGKGEELFDHFEKKNLIKGTGCYKGCVLKCSRIANVASGKWQTPQHEGCEYETICAFTFYVLNEDMDAAVYAAYLCNEYGLDTISAGAAIAFAMDCYEQGLLSEMDTGGLDLTWGNTKTMVELVRQIGDRKGLGKLLGEGVKRASQQIGERASASDITVKGLEGPAHDGRSGKTLTLMYGTSNRGMCHIHPLEGMAYDSLQNSFGLVPFGLQDPKTVDRWAEKGKGKAAKLLQDFGILPDILGICKFFSYNGLGLPELSELLTALTGWEVDGKELLTIGERVFNLQRMFNIREGITRADDLVPRRTAEIPEFGRYADKPECGIKDYEKMLEEYYEARAWKKDTGRPTRDKLRQLGLESLSSEAK